MRKLFREFVTSYQSILNMKREKVISVPYFSIILKTILIFLFLSTTLYFILDIGNYLDNYLFLYTALSFIFVSTYVSYKIILEKSIKKHYDFDYQIIKSILYDVVIILTFFFLSSSMIIFTYFRIIFSFYLILTIFIISMIALAFTFLMHRYIDKGVNSKYLLFSVIWSSAVFILVVILLPLESIVLSVIIGIVSLVVIYLLKLKLLNISLRLWKNAGDHNTFNDILSAGTLGNVSAPTLSKIRFNFSYQGVSLISKRNGFSSQNNKHRNQHGSNVKYSKKRIFNIVVLIIITFLILSSKSITNRRKSVYNQTISVQIVEKINIENKLGSYRCSTDTKVLLGSGYIYIVCDKVYVFDFDFNLINEINFKEDYAFSNFYIDDGILKAQQIVDRPFTDSRYIDGVFSIQYYLDYDWEFREEIKLYQKELTPVFLLDYKFVNYEVQNRNAIRYHTGDFGYIIHEKDDYIINSIIYKSSTELVYTTDRRLYVVNSQNRVSNTAYSNNIMFSDRTFYKVGDNVDKVELPFRIYISGQTNFFYYLNYMYYISYFDRTEFTNYLIILDNEGVVKNKIPYLGVMALNKNMIVMSDPSVRISSLTNIQDINFYSLNPNDPSHFIMPTVSSENTKYAIALLSLLFILQINLFSFKEDRIYKKR